MTTFADVLAVDERVAGIRRKAETRDQQEQAVTDAANGYEPSEDVIWWAMRELMLPRPAARRWLICQRAAGVVIEMDAAS